MKLLIVGDGSLQVVTPDELREVVGLLLEHNPSLPEFVTEVVTLEGDRIIGVCADIYAKHYRLKRRIEPFDFHKTDNACKYADAAIQFGEDSSGVCPTMNSLGKAALVIPYPSPVKLGVMTGIDATGERVELTLAEQEALDAELVK